VITGEWPKAPRGTAASISVRDHDHQGARRHVTTSVNGATRVFWHRQLPPLAAEIMAEHTVEADSERIAGAFVHGDSLWGRCYDDLTQRTEARLLQEIARLGGDYAHVHDESITPKHDAAKGESWLHGRFTYMLYRHKAIA
jgi:hypothetical protein